jgi:hypothetical protein
VSAKTQIRLKDRNDIVAAVPYLVGFPPEDSVVCVALDAGRRIQFVARLDLPAAAEEPSLPESTASVTELLA